MTKTATKKSPPEPTEIQSVSETEAPSYEQIATRAYHIYLERGGADGNSDEDWLQAERELAGTSDQQLTE